jgi:putative aminopeptidase FrvX
MRWSPSRAGALLIAAAACPAAASAQGIDSLVNRFGAMSAVTGLEDAVADTLVTLLPGARRDRGGNVVLVRGSGAPVRVIGCPMDEIGYVVGGITPEGYLTLRRVGATNVGPLYDQFLEGQRVTVFGRRGAVPGVVGVRSTHLTRGRSAADDPPFNLDNAYVDVGAASPRDVAALGIAMLSPLTRAKKVQRYGARGGLAAAPWMAQHAACAALLSAARRAAPGSGTSVVAFTARRHLGNDGAVFLVNSFPGADVVLLGAASSGPLGSGPQPATDTTGGRTVNTWALPARYVRTPVESVAIGDVEQLEARIAAWLEGR